MPAEPIPDYEPISDTTGDADPQRLGYDSDWIVAGSLRTIAPVDPWAVGIAVDPSKGPGFLWGQIYPSGDEVVESPMNAAGEFWYSNYFRRLHLDAHDGNDPFVYVPIRDARGQAVRVVLAPGVTTEIRTSLEDES